MRGKPVKVYKTVSTVPGGKSELIKRKLHSLLCGTPWWLKHSFMHPGINSTVMRLIHSNAHENSDSDHGKQL